MDRRVAEGLVNEFLKLSGSSAMNVDGSTPKKFTYTNATTDWILTTMRMTITDANADIVADKFGGIAALTNGIKIEIIDTDGSTVLENLIGGDTIKQNSDFFFVGSYDLHSGVTDGAIQVNIDFTEGGAVFRILTDQIIQVTVQDDLTGITSFETFIKGHIL